MIIKSSSLNSRSESESSGLGLRWRLAWRAQHPEHGAYPRMEKPGQYCSRMQGSYNEPQKRAKEIAGRRQVLALGANEQA